MLAVLGYLLVSLWPFTWDPPERVANGARIEGEAGLQFPSPGLARTGDPPEWLASAGRTGRLEIMLRVRPLLTRQSGPARILSISGDGFERNLLIGQRGDDLVARLRTPPAGASGSARDAERAVRVRDVFVAGDWLDIFLAITPGELSLSIGEDREVRRELASDPLRTWDATYRLTFGNEITGSHPWLGDIERVVVRTPDAVYAYPGAAPLERPANFWIMSREPKLQPFSHLNPRDTVNNLLLYVPLGLCFAISPRAGTRSAALRGLLLVGGLSASVEVAQLFVSSRNPSINDFILNVAGGAIGYAAGRRLARWAERIWRAGQNLAVTRSR
jgi:VanZ family protein